jgi:hypothetical protein
VLQWAGGSNATSLEPQFLATLEDFARRAAQHRYAVPIVVTSAFRPGEAHAHSYGQAVDIRGVLPPSWSGGPLALRLKLYVFLAALWAETVRDHGYAPGQWGIGVYPPPDDLHIHLDTRPHVGPPLYAAVWTARD